MASPHTRGWTVDATGAAGASLGFPAHAGMDLTGLVDGTAGTAGFPAHAGMDLEAYALALQSTEASPHTRGWTPRAEGAGRRGRGFPAHAGMDRW